MTDKGRVRGATLLGIALGGIAMTEALYGCSSDDGVRQFVEENVGQVGEALGDNTTTVTAVSALPLGLTCGLKYSVYGRFFPPLDYYWGSDCTSLAGAGYGWVQDGDFGVHSDYGFSHYEYGAGTADLSVSTRFALPKGTTCGFHHTLNSPSFGSARTCMGYDPAAGQCPNGWLPKKHFDMSSDTGYFAWCEYQDPNALCTSTDCVLGAVNSGIGCGVSSDTDPAGAGQCAGLATVTLCPSQTTRSPFFDDGRSSGQGVGWCYHPASWSQ